MAAYTATLLSSIDANDGRPVVSKPVLEQLTPAIDTPAADVPQSTRLTKDAG